MSRFTPEMSWQDKVAVLGRGCHPRARAVMNSLSIGNEEILDVVDRLDIMEDIDRLYDVCRGDLELLATLLVLTDVGVAGLDKENLHHAAHNHGAGIDLRAVAARAGEAAGYMLRYRNSS